MVHFVDRRVHVLLKPASPSYRPAAATPWCRSMCSRPWHFRWPR